MTISSKIPSDIYRKILDAEKNEEPSCRVRYYPYFELQGGELAIAVVGVKTSGKKTKGKRHKCLYIKKVTVHIVGQENCYIRDIDFHGLGGYIIEFNNEPLYDTPRKKVIVNLYSDGYWYNHISAKYYRIYNAYRKILNIEFLKTLPEYKFCGYDGVMDALDYLNKFKENPKIELLAKTLMPKLATSKLLITRAEKDKNFVFWLRDNAAKIRGCNADPATIIHAYKHNIDIEKIVIEKRAKKFFAKEYYDEKLHPAVQIYQQGDDKLKDRIIAYLKHNYINAEHYDDYIKALIELKLDTQDSKNIFPIDWKYWSGVRFNQYETLIAKRNAKLWRKLNRQIKEVAKKYTKLASGNSEYIAIIADSKNSLVREGKVLHHCVGGMDYDQRIIKEKSLIFFIRKKDDLEMPLATVEFSLSDGGIKQCYGLNDKTPDANVLSFVREYWQPKAKRALEQIIAKSAA